MGKQMPFTDNRGNSNAATYWKPVQINISILDRSCVLVFYGYKNKAVSLTTPPAEPSGQKRYRISGPKFDTFMAKVLAKNKDIVALVYDLASETKDVVVDPSDETKNVGFFDVAVDV